jgi:hypothetical protein
MEAREPGGTGRTKTQATMQIFTRITGGTCS